MKTLNNTLNNKADLQLKLAKERQCFQMLEQQLRKISLQSQQITTTMRELRKQLESPTPPSSNTTS